MTGAKLYDKHVKALYDTRHWRYKDGVGELRTFDQRPASKHWLWLSDDEREYWNTLARLIAPRPRKRTNA